MQCISDLHLEFYKSLNSIPKIPVNAPILVLAGDIGYPTLPLYWEFIKHTSELFEHVILVPGNHEYYHSNTRINKRMILSISEIDELIQGQIQNLDLKNVHFLQKSEIVLGSTRFIGTTLWSHIPLQKAIYIAESMADFQRSFIDRAIPLSISSMNQLHAEHKEFLKKTLETHTDAKKTVVITHHMPSMRLIAKKYEKSMVNSAFASTVLEDLPIKPDIWICGHSHCRIDTILDETRVIINAVGYPGEIPINDSLFQPIDITN